MNAVGKLLVLVHTAFSVAAMTWAMLLVLQGRDYGWGDPAREVVERGPDGSEKKVVRHASEWDKSIVAVREAYRTRDNTMTYVQPALDSLRASEPYLPVNRLFYIAELTRLKEAKDKIDVQRLQKQGFALEPGTGNLGKPVFDKGLAGLDQSYTTSEGELKVLLKQIDDMEAKIRTIVIDTRKLTDELTGTDEMNKYVHPGLYQMIDMEYKTQTQFKIEIDDIKPNWSKAVEHARRFQYRRLDLEATLEKLTGPLKK